MGIETKLNFTLDQNSTPHIYPSIHTIPHSPVSSYTNKILSPPRCPIFQHTYKYLYLPMNTHHTTSPLHLSCSLSPNNHTPDSLLHIDTHLFFHPNTQPSLSTHIFCSPSMYTHTQLTAHTHKHTHLSPHPQTSL